MSQIKGVVFDHDGTLINSLPQVIQATREVLEEFSFKQLSDTEIRHSMILATTERMAFSARRPDDLELGAKMAKRWFERADALALAETEVYEGIESLASKLYDKKVKLAVLSNNRGSLVRKILATRHLIEYFSMVFGEEDVPAPKPDGRGLESILRAWNLNADEVLFVGDSSADLGAAKHVGCKSLGVCWGAHTREELESMQWDTLVDKVVDAHHYFEQLL